MIIKRYYGFHDDNYPLGGNGSFPYVHSVLNLPPSPWIRICERVPAIKPATCCFAIFIASAWVLVTFESQ